MTPHSLARYRREVFDYGGAMSDLRRDYRNDYVAGGRNRFIRERTGLGGSGDAHYASQYKFDRIREFADDMDRNDSMPGPIVDRAVQNQLQCGFTLRPNTGDEALDTDIRADFEFWADDPLQCDFYEEHTFWELTWYAERGALIHGDHFGILTPYQQLQTLESYRCVSPKLGDMASDQMVHGVELAGRRKVAFWFARDEGIERRGLNGRINSKVDRRPRFDEAGDPAVLQLYYPNTCKRKTMARGVSAFAPVFVRLGMFEDTQFATLLKQQVAALLVFFLQRNSDYTAGTTKFGRQNRETLGTEADSDDTNTRWLEKMQAGLIARGAKGEELKALSPQIPANEYFHHMKMILTEVGINLGVPLILGLMDASETNFSGWRGAFDQAKLGFRMGQKWTISRWMQPIHWWRLRLRMEEGVFGQTIRQRVARMDSIEFKRTFGRHRWSTPVWPYIQPLQDAQANAMKFWSGQMDWDQMQTDAGNDPEEAAHRRVTGFANLVREAKTAAKTLNDAFADDGAPVTWRDLVQMQLPQGMSLTMTGPQQGDDGEETPKRRNAETPPSEARQEVPVAA